MFRFVQIPCFETRSDGRDNFVGALILAGNYNIPEVCVYFRHQLMRGNRSSFHSNQISIVFANPSVALFDKNSFQNISNQSNV